MPITYPKLEQRRSIGPQATTRHSGPPHTTFFPRFPHALGLQTFHSIACVPSSKPRYIPTGDNLFHTRNYCWVYSLYLSQSEQVYLGREIGALEVQVMCVSAWGPWSAARSSISSYNQRARSPAAKFSIFFPSSSPLSAIVGCQSYLSTCTGFLGGRFWAFRFCDFSLRVTSLGKTAMGLVECL